MELRKLAALVCLLSMAVTGCTGGGQASSGSSAPTPAQVSKPKLINGVPRGGAFPESVTLISRYTDGAATFCTGSFIGPKLIITAAHCAAELLATNELSDIVALHVAADGTPESFTGTLIHIPANWNEPHIVPGTQATAFPYDMAILEIAEEYAGPTAVLTIAPPVPGEVLFLVGGGQDETGALHPEALMGAATVDATTTDPSFVLWLNRPGQSFPCQGDSGGPNYHLIGEGLYLSGLTQGAFSSSGNCEYGGVSVSVQLTQEHIDYIRTVAGDNFSFAG